MILGIGGVRMLDSIGYHEIKKYHMNEGHAAFLTVELLRKTFRDSDCEEKCYDLEKVREKCVFTTHTPVAAGHDMFDVDLVRKMLGDFIPEFIFEKATEDNRFGMTLLALMMSKFINGVAKRHGEVTRQMFPEYHIDSITNGSHPLTWVSPSFKEVFDKHIPGWQVDPFTLRYALSIPREEIWQAHYLAKIALVEEVNRRTNLNFDKDRFTIGFARRFTEYKRPSMILHDIEKLKSIAKEVGDIQIVFAGKAHISDTQGKKIMKEIINTAKDINKQNCRIRIAFLEHYDMRLGRTLVAGSDIWLNTPQRPFEASGTSGMKAALNGVPHVSTLDGWWLEGHIENVTGWSIGAHPHDPDFTNQHKHLICIAAPSCRC
jgi:starch phosphorylase